jgi:hypothetical protein
VDLRASSPEKKSWSAAPLRLGDDRDGSERDKTGRNEWTPDFQTEKMKKKKRKWT